MKLVVNRRFGGFGLSQKAYKQLIELGFPEGPYIKEERDPETGLFVRNAWEEKIIYNTGEVDFFYDSEKYWATWFRSYENRNDPLLIQVVEKLGKEANGRCAELAVIEIPDDIEWGIEDYDGIETVHEAHESW